MIDALDVRDFLGTMHRVHGRPEADDDLVNAWHSALVSITGDELREAGYTALTESPHMPTPADILRIAREKRVARQPDPPKEDPRGRIPLADGARQILAALEERMRANGQRVPNRRPA